MSSLCPSTAGRRNGDGNTGYVSMGRLVKDKVAHNSQFLSSPFISITAFSAAILLRHDIVPRKRGFPRFWNSIWSFL